MASESEYIRCPHCNARLKKDPVLSALGSVRGYLVSGPETKPCSVCSNPINCKAAIDGEYDEKWNHSGLIEVSVIAILIVLAYRFCG